MRWWTPISAAVAPAALIGSWTVAGARRAGFSSVTDSISALAAAGAPDRWIVTAGLAVTGCCYLLTAAGLTSAGRPGRVLLAVGGVATLAVAAFPLPAAHGSSAPHAISATSAFIALSLWPVLAVRRGAPAPLAAAVAYPASGLLVALLAGFGVALRLDRYVGVSERLAAAAQSVWLLLLTALLLAMRNRGPQAARM